jgi:hypothetical protein
MVASTSKTPALFSVSPMVQRMGFGAVTFTVDDVQRMVAQNLLPEDCTIELLDGTIIYRDRFDLKGGEIVPGIQHDFVVSNLANLNFQINNEHRHIRTEKTLVCDARHAPLPDACIVRGVVRDYATRYPTSADAWCVIEVADSSYERDAGEKLAGYARAGIEQYVILNLRNRTAEIYTRPLPDAGTYSAKHVIAETDRLALRVGPEQFLEIPLRDLLV